MRNKREKMNTFEKKDVNLEFKFVDTAEQMCKRIV